jgi:HAD superfamily hydrolase (TIGR01509 family)
MRTVIWDLGGTLLDTYPVVDRALARALTGRGEPDVDLLDEVARLTRVSSGHAIAQLSRRHGVPEPVLRDAYAATREIWRHDPPAPMAGAEQVLALVRSRGGLNLVATHRDRQSATELLAAAGLEVDDLVSASDGFPRKPDPGMVRELLERHGLDPTDVLMVGDRPADVAAAEAAGVQGILLATPGVDHGRPGIPRITALAELVELIGPD